ncbi:Cullin-associated NEDD8-dissociated protein 1 [Parelaphostrongylus tenuis]|uniref:Cullin-associated NEDD8-dissociated protein 1 n=1 Tax=Parelaphostrongylus tenuis TaxID=148309 RepID=A0AAD5MM14_PARTN|nr:Cullin-associated NEDD8-dissociated protein 1 [Parelaphostrongylus tenuis]
MATTATSAYHVAQLIDKMMSVDKDYRFMAVNDLMRELQTNNMRLDDDSEKKVVRMLVRLLDDNNGEVQNLAVKCLGTVTQRVKEAQAETLVDALCSMMVAGSDSLRDVSSIALKTVVGNLPLSNPVFVTNLMKRLVPKLNSALEQTKTNDSVRLEIVDIIGDVLSRFGSLITSAHKETQKVLLDQLLLERPALKKKATIALSAMMAVCPHELFIDTMDVLVERLTDAKGSHSVRTYVIALTCVAKSNGSRFAEYIPKVVPKVMEQVESADDDELKEALLQYLETLICHCPREMAPYHERILKIVTADLTYDPNYSYSDDEEDTSMEVGDGDTDEDDAEDYSDDDDMSWKVRRASAKTIEAMILSRRDQLTASVKSLGPLLISRLREREENVRVDIYNAYIAILSQARLVVPNALAAVHRDESEEPITIGTTLFSPSALSEEQQQLLEAIAEQSEPLLKAIMRQLRLKSARTRSLSFELLAHLVRTLPGSLAPYLSGLLPGISSAVLDRSSGAPMKIDALTLLSRIIKSHDHSVFAPHLESVVELTIGAIRDVFYKVSAEGLAVASLLAPVIRDCGAGYLVPNLFDAIFEKLKINDIDQEVKERAIYAAGLFVATFANDMPSVVPTTLELLVERLRNEMTRLCAVRALIMVAESRAPLVDLSTIASMLLPTITDFLKKNSRALRIGTLHLLEALLLRRDLVALDSNDLSQVFAELPSLSKESDLQISQLSLKCITVGLEAYPARVAPHLTPILSAVILLSQSALLQGATLQTCLEMIRTLVSDPIPGKPDFEELLDQLTAPVYDVANLPRQAFQSISAITGVVAAASGDIIKVRSLAYKLADQLQNENSTDAIVLFSIHALGELGRRCPKVYDDFQLEPENLIIPSFNSNSEDLKSAAAQALGALAVGNHARFLPFILNEIQTQPKRQYLLLHALKEVIGHESTSVVPIEVFRSRISEIWPVLIAHADGTEEGTRNVVAECLGKLCVIDPHGLLPELKALVTSPSARVRSAAVTAVKFMISDEKRPVDVVLQQCIGEFLQTMTDSDLNVRRVALAVLNSAAHNKPSLIRSLLDVLLPSVYSETKVRKELIREVEMGPFKHQVDDGLDLRKSAFECMYTLLESCLEKLEIFEFINYVENGLKDMHHDIRLISYLMLIKLAQLSPNQLVQRLDKICESLKAQLQIKPKNNAVKQEIDKQEELKRAVIRVVLALQKIPDADRHQQLSDVLALMRSSSELRALTEAVQRDAMRTFAVGDVPMETI